MSEEIKDNATVEEPENKPTEETKESEEKLVPQSEVDRIINERLARERKKLDKYADYDELKKRASEYEAKLEEQRLAELSEKERADELAKKAEGERDQYSQELEALRKQVRDEKINNAFITAATAQNIAYIDDAIRLADLSAVEIGEDGKPVGIEDVVKALVENKPYLLAQSKPAPIGESSNHNDNKKSEKTAEQLIREAAEKARTTGRIEDRIAYDKLKRELQK